MEALYYIPFVYNDDAKPCCTTHLLRARAECLEWFHCVHPEAFIAVGPLFSFVRVKADQAPQ